MRKVQGECFIARMIPCPRLPVFFPLFWGGDLDRLREEDAVDGVSTGTLLGHRATSSLRGPLIEKGDGDLEGHLVWLNATRYDEIIGSIDRGREGAGWRTICDGFSSLGETTVQCWAYVDPGAAGHRGGGQRP